MTLRLIPLAAAREPSVAPDLIWNEVEFMADLGLAGAAEPDNRFGLRARSALTTAVLICLMTDARADPAELREGDENRGWFGDSFDLDARAGETPIGSKLWLLRRRTVDDVETPRLAETYATEALQTLIDQGAVAAVTAQATADPARNRLDLTVTLTDRDGELIIAPRFRLLWSELDGISAEENR